MSDIIVNNLKKSFKNGDTITTVLDVDNLHISGSSITAITGKSGSGKSTFLQILAGLENPTSGNVSIGGLSISEKKLININQLSNNEKSIIRRKDLGFIYQKNFLLKDFNVIDNLLIANNSKEKALYLLNEVGLIDKKDRLHSQLSGGEKQRVSICRALMNDPIFIFADEPTGSLDVENTEKIWNLFLKLKKTHDFGLIMVTHDLELANYCDINHKMVNGRIV